MNITYRHRQAVMQSQDGIHTKVALVVSDKIDWESNSRTFTNKGKYTTWLFDLAKTYDVDFGEFTDCVDNLIKEGFYSLSQAPRNRWVLTRTMPKGWGV